jgi:hypothetical protein
MRLPSGGLSRLARRGLALTCWDLSGGDPLSALVIACDVVDARRAGGERAQAGADVPAVFRFAPRPAL